MKTLSKKQFLQSAFVMAAFAFLLFSELALSETIKKLNGTKDRAVLSFKRKTVRDLYEADIITIRMVSSNVVINAAVIKKSGLQALVGILPDQNLEGLEEGAEFVFVEENRQPSHIVWAKVPADVQLTDSPNLGTDLLIGYRTLQAGSSSYSSELGFGLALRGLYRSFTYGGFGIDFDAFRSNIDFAEANQKGKFSHRRTRVYTNLTISERTSVGGDLLVQVASRDILNADQDGTLGTDYASNQYGAVANYRGYNYNIGIRYRNRGSLRMRIDKETGSGREVEPLDLSSQYGIDYWQNNERTSAFYLRLTYFKFENLHGDLKPSIIERINFSGGFESFLNAQRSLYFDFEKLAPYTPDSFGILRNTSTLNLSVGLNSIFSKDYHFLSGLMVGYGTDKQDFVKGQVTEKRNFTEVVLGILAKLEYQIR